MKLNELKSDKKWRSSFQICEVNLQKQNIGFDIQALNEVN